MNHIWTDITSVLFAFTSILLIFIVLLQRGRGGGLAGAFGAAGGQSAFGTKAGDVFTRITIGIALKIEGKEQESAGEVVPGKGTPLEKGEGEMKPVGKGAQATPPKGGEGPQLTEPAAAPAKTSAPPAKTGTGNAPKSAAPATKK